MTNNEKRRLLITTGIFAFILGVLLDLSLAKADPNKAVIVLLEMLLLISSFLLISWSIMKAVKIYLRKEIKYILKEEKS